MNKLKNLLSNINSYILSMDSLFVDRILFIVIFILCSIAFVAMG